MYMYIPHASFLDIHIFSSFLCIYFELLIFHFSCHNIIFPAYFSYCYRLHYPILSLSYPVALFFFFSFSFSLPPSSHVVLSSCALIIQAGKEREAEWLFIFSLHMTEASFFGKWRKILKHRHIAVVCTESVL